MEALLPRSIDARVPFVELVDRPDLQQKILWRLKQAIERSFAEDLARVAPAARESYRARLRTQREERRRAAQCYEILRDLCHGGIGLIQASDHLAAALRARLDGTPYTPPQRGRIWTPT